MRTEALQRAITIAGGQKPLADKIGVHQSKVWYWLERSKTGVTPTNVIDIERVTGVSRHELRPDIWPPVTAGAAA